MIDRPQLRVKYAPDNPPAYWSWPVPPYVEVSTEEEALELLESWNTACAICGTPETYYTSLVTDHDHETGLVRGMLCNPCNVREGRTHSPALRMYRKKNPATILGLKIRYWSQSAGYAQPLPERSAAELRAIIDLTDRLRQSGAEPTAII